MALGLLQYNWKIDATIRQAEKQGAISTSEYDILCTMVEESAPAASTADREAS